MIVCSQTSTSCSRGPLRPHGDSNGLPVVGAAGAHGHHHPEGCCWTVAWASNGILLTVICVGEIKINRVYLGFNIWEMKTWYHLITSDKFSNVFPNVCPTLVAVWRPPSGFSNAEPGNSTGPFESRCVPCCLWICVDQALEKADLQVMVGGPIVFAFNPAGCFIPTLDW